MNDIGTYTHYKGGNYILHTIGLDADTSDHVAIYSNGQGVMFVRPAIDFFGNVYVDGQTFSRFKRVMKVGDAK